ncbi:iron-containing redox enzyme family protein [Allorhizobium sp. BGMRC 0089]|uniref:TenA family transcriptional regulator n=1 Tax=Allorhizobium sonneratiae TaxID=2934936 RepID=UPI0020331FF3|nr:iron-containing redox enzyme family protein [Allorhizobium sonneratiae]MCM2293792.1 iron-containing redox enzyme family protein [Allorhizobium sonneratiae]
MSFYDRLNAETASERNAFLQIPLVAQATVHGAPREVYIAFLEQAYHHVKHTFPLLALAASRTRDEYYQDALVEYMEEERGHEKWILDDIRALGGNADAVEKGEPGQACAIMVGYAYYAIEHISPYAMLGSVHVLEGLSVMLADTLADVLKSQFSLSDDAGFSYLRSHGSLDQEHVAFFRDTINGFTDKAVQDLIIAQSKIFYRLYGAIFKDLAKLAGLRHAA